MLKALREKTSPLRRKEFCLQIAFRSRLQYQLLPQCPASQPALQVSDLPAPAVAWSLYFSFSLPYLTYTHTHTHTHTYSYWFCFFWGTLIQRLSLMIPSPLLSNIHAVTNTELTVYKMSLANALSSPPRLGLSS